MQCQLLGLGQHAKVVLLHSRPEGDNIVALTTTTEVTTQCTHCLVRVACAYFRLECGAMQLLSFASMRSDLLICVCKFLISLLY